MTTQPEGTPPPQAAPPHATTQPPAQQTQQPRPVVVQQNDPGLQGQIESMAQTLLAMPEKVANAIREATSSQTSTPPPAQSQAVQTANVEQATNTTHARNTEKQGYKPSGFGVWWHTAGLKKKS